MKEMGILSLLWNKSKKFNALGIMFEAKYYIPCWKYTAWKVSKYGVISGPYLPVFGLIMEIITPEITPYLDTFHAE